MVSHVGWKDKDSVNNDTAHICRLSTPIEKTNVVNDTQIKYTMTKTMTNNGIKIMQLMTYKMQTQAIDNELTNTKTNETMTMQTRSNNYKKTMKAMTCRQQQQ